MTVTNQRKKVSIGSTEWSWARGSRWLAWWEAEKRGARSVITGCMSPAMFKEDALAHIRNKLATSQMTSVPSSGTVLVHQGILPQGSTPTCCALRNHQATL